ncbi:putative VAN3-binding protein [Helianthus anomalus]
MRSSIVNALIIIIIDNKLSVVLDQHAELYKNPYDDRETCFLIVLTTTRGIIKLDMMNDNECYKIWTWTINQMISLLTPSIKHSLPYLKN